MRRSGILLFPVLAILVASLVAGEDRKEKTTATKESKSTTKTESKTSKPAPLFDVDEFIKEYDANKDSALSKEEMPSRFRHVFDKMDTNKDGKLSRDELEKGMHQLQPPRRPSDFVFVLVEMSDCDECCAEELQVIYAFLRKLDKDNSGKIDAEELKKAREQLVEKRVSGIIKELDTDKDGKISKEEARGFLKHHFAELDTNKDGFVSRAELHQAAEEKPGSLEKIKGKKGSPSKKDSPAPKDS